MALQIDRSGPIKKVKGIYKNQRDWFPAGKRIFSVDGFPFTLGAFLGGDSATINIFFDPSQSRFSRRFGYEYVGLMQVGEFFINHYSLPIDFYDVGSLIATNDNFIDFGRDYPSQVWYPDICDEDAAGHVVDPPFFGLWQKSNDASFDFDGLFRFPQSYGGLTHFDPRKNNAAAIGRGENLTAYLTANEKLGLGDLPPSILITDYIDQIDPADYFMTTTVLPSDSSQEVIDDYLVTNHYTSQSFKHPFSKVRHLVNSAGNRLLIEEKVSPFSFDDNPLRYILVLPDPEDEQHLGIIELDDDFTDNYISSRDNSAPDRVRLKNQIQTNYSYSFYDSGNPILSKEFITFACSYVYNAQQRRVSIQMLEGISWKISNFYNQQNGWSNIALSEVKRCTTDLIKRFRFQVGIERFYEKRFPNEEVVWPNDFKP
ncbi:MAG: hypothetical protein KI790_12535 [Cyclobacteriaceae bacterium]|nr:hypothetical protein [Cyclobacteriaceae bacterium HetDA_MAG_MS6]